MKVGIIGCGNLGMSLATGFLTNSNVESIIGSKRNWENVTVPSNLLTTTANEDVLEKAEIIILALKPYNVIPFLEENKDLIKANKHTIISVATGITIAEMKVVVGDVDLMRGMPNTAAAVKESITALSVGTDKLGRTTDVVDLFNSIGNTVKIDEALMESATVLGACGIAYVLRFMRAMIQGGIEVGFDAQTATKIVAQTVKGAAQLIIENNTHPEEEIDKVTTPKGCTIVGLNEMEHSGFSSALIKGLVTSYQKIEK